MRHTHGYFYGLVDCAYTLSYLLALLQPLQQIVDAGPSTGWRWYPVPAPKTKSHEHRFYPPSSSLSGVAAWQTAAKKKPRATKKPAGAPDLSLQYLSSPEACLYLASLG